MATPLWSAAPDDRDRGAVYVFEKIDGSWRQVEKLTGHGRRFGGFGTDVDIDGDYLLVGAPGIDHTSTVVGPATASLIRGEMSLSYITSNYVGLKLRFTSGDLKDESRAITSYDGSSKQLGLGSPFSAAPSPGDSFVIEKSAEYNNAFFYERGGVGLVLRRQGVQAATIRISGTR